MKSMGAVQAYNGRVLRSIDFSFSFIQLFVEKFVR